MDAIVVKGLEKTYGRGKNKLKALDGLSFTVKKGEMLGLLGSNGAGKTTTINILTGILFKDKGSVTVFGKDLEKHKQVIKQNMNFGSAYSWLTGILTIRQNLRVYGKIYAVKNLEKRIDELLTVFDIKDIEHNKVFTLSTGQIVRVILCKSLINNPKVLLLDECTVGLDPTVAQRTRQLLKEYQKKYNTTILFTSHNMLEVEMLCDRIAIMAKGKIIAEGTPKEIRNIIPSRSIKIDAFGKIPLKIALEKFNLDITSAKNDTIIFKTESDKTLPAVLNHLVKEGFDLVDVKVRKPSLEEVFIHITKGEKQ